jgi:hypothetical protein
LEDPGVDGRIILKWIFNKWDGEGIDWIDMVGNRDRYLDLYVKCPIFSSNFDRNGIFLEIHQYQILRKSVQ